MDEFCSQCGSRFPSVSDAFCTRCGANRRGAGRAQPAQHVTQQHAVVSSRDVAYAPAPAPAPQQQMVIAPAPQQQMVRTTRTTVATETTPTILCCSLL